MATGRRLCLSPGIMSIFLSFIAAIILILGSSDVVESYLDTLNVTRRLRRSRSRYVLNPPESPARRVKRSSSLPSRLPSGMTDEGTRVLLRRLSRCCLAVYTAGLLDTLRQQEALKAPLEDTGPRVEKFLSSKPTKAALLAAVTRQVDFNLGPTSEIPMQSCGANSMARIYSPDEVVRRLKLTKPPCLGPVEDTIREFNMFVTENGEAMEKVRENIKPRPHKAFRLAYIQWNALMVKPNTLELLAAFLNEAQGFQADEVDGVTILLQENMKLDSRREQQMLTNIQFVLNLLSTDPNWGTPSLAYLGNLIGTQAQALLTPNTQTIIHVMRETHTPVTVCKAEQAIRKREKGFVGAVFEVPQMGRLAVMGGHLKGWSAEQFENVFPELIKFCGSRQLGLDSFSLGVVFGADFNEHFHAESLAHLYKTAATESAQYPIFEKAQELPEDVSDNLKMTHLLMEALTEPLDIIDSTYVPLLWSVDRLGRSVNIEGAPKTIPASMRHLGFRTISTCYRAGITYKWLRGCRYPNELPKEGHSPFSVLKRCLASKVYTSNRGAGYLDRVAIRLPTSSTAVLDRIIEVGSAGESLPAVFASIRKGVHVYDLRSDHLMVGSIIEFLKLD